MEKIEFTVQNFIEFLKKYLINDKFSDLIIIIDYANAAQGGCSCNRSKREKALHDIYKDKILNLNIEVIEEIKNLNNVKEVIFYDQSNNILKQF